MTARDVGRLVFAIVFFLGVQANTAMGLFTPSAYETFPDDALVPLYRALWQGLIYARIRLFLTPVVLLELALAWFLVQSGVEVRTGLGLALVFALLLVPFWWQGPAAANLVVALALVWLLSGDYSHSIWTTLGW
jgi:hypothetical protein